MMAEEFQERVIETLGEIKGHIQTLFSGQSKQREDMVAFNERQTFLAEKVNEVWGKVNTLIRDLDHEGKTKGRDWIDRVFYLAVFLGLLAIGGVGVFAIVLMQNILQKVGG